MTPGDITAAFRRSTKLRDPRALDAALALYKARRRQVAAFKSATDFELARANQAANDAEEALRALVRRRFDACGQCGRFLYGDPAVCLYCHRRGPVSPRPALVRPSMECDCDDCDVCYDRLSTTGRSAPTMPRLRPLRM